MIFHTHNWSRYMELVERVFEKVVHPVATGLGKKNLGRKHLTKNNREHRHFWTRLYGWVQTAAIIEMGEAGLLDDKTLIVNGALNVRLYDEILTGYQTGMPGDSVFSFMTEQFDEMVSVIPELHESTAVGDSMYWTHVMPRHFAPLCAQAGKFMYRDLLFHEIEKTALILSEWALHIQQTERFAADVTAQVGFLQARDALQESWNGRWKELVAKLGLERAKFLAPVLSRLGLLKEIVQSAERDFGHTGSDQAGRACHQNVKRRPAEQRKVMQWLLASGLLSSTPLAHSDNEDGEEGEGKAGAKQVSVQPLLDVVRRTDGSSYCKALAVVGASVGTNGRVLRARANGRVLVEVVVEGKFEVRWVSLQDVYCMGVVVLAEKCDACSLVIPSGVDVDEVYRHGAKVYHAACLVCYQCSVLLDLKTWNGRAQYCSSECLEAATADVRPDVAEQPILNVKGDARLAKFLGRKEEPALTSSNVDVIGNGVVAPAMVGMIKKGVEKCKGIGRQRRQLYALNARRRAEAERLESRDALGPTMDTKMEERGNPAVSCPFLSSFVEDALKKEQQAYADLHLARRAREVGGAGVGMREDAMTRGGGGGDG